MDYLEIQNLAYKYADRTDVETTSRYDDFLKVVEARVNRVIQTLKMSTRATIITEAGREYYGLPADFEGMRDLQLQDAEVSGDTITLEYKTPAQINEYSNLNFNTSGIYYSIIADQLQIADPQDTKVMEMIYYKKVPPLTAAETINWLSIENPDCYVFGVVTEISAFVKDADAASLWGDRFTNSLAEIKSNDIDTRWGSGNALVTRVV